MNAVVKAPMPRPVRLKNPLDIERDGTLWEGLTPDQPDPRFCQFTTNAFGFRAGFRCLIAYYDKHNLKTVTDIISRWAPGNENDTAAYIKAVCARTHFGPTEEINPKSWADGQKLIYAMAEVESGTPFEQYYKASELAEGAYRAGIADAPKAPIKKIGVILTATGAGVASVAPQAIDAFTQYRPALDAINSPTFKTILGVVGGLLAVFAIVNHVRSSKGSSS